MELSVSITKTTIFNHFIPTSIMFMLSRKMSVLSPATALLVITLSLSVLFQAKGQFVGIFGGSSATLAGKLSQVQYFTLEGTAPLVLTQEKHFEQMLANLAIAKMHVTIVCLVEVRVITMTVQTMFF